MGFNCGIIGLPNVGKSTIFNALTSANAASENFPFCTIEPNTGIVPVPEPRLEPLAKLADSKKIVPTRITFVDIAGLIRGASRGEGLGNQFLGHIRNVDAIAHIVRCFEDDNVVHVDGSIDPVRDIETVNTELLLADLETLQKQIAKLEKTAKSGEKEIRSKLEFVREIEAHLSEGEPARAFSRVDNPEWEQEFTKDLLTSKKTLLVANVDEERASYSPVDKVFEPIDKLYDYAASHNCELIIISGQVEAEIAELPLDERKEYLEDLGLELSGLDKLTLSGYQLLDLITFFTADRKEAHAWTVTKGTKVPQCGGKIHSDFEQGFIRAEVIKYDDYVDCGGEVQAKEMGKMRIEGKDYICQEGDVIRFRFNS
jgi:ribosome-binding ATPase